MNDVAYDTYREETAGRANVPDNPELVAYYQKLGKLNTAALWTVANKIEPWEPVSQSVPMVWRYKELRQHVLDSVSLVSPEDAGRRVIYFDNPGRRDVAAAVGWLYSGLQVMHPGEAASAHWHSSSALRFIMEGKGAYTIVNGHKLTLGANDFVITPNGCWHEHGVAEDGLPCIWQDGLDIPLANAMEAGFFGVHPDLHQAVAHPINDSVGIWGAPGLRPQNVGWTAPYSPLFKYQWDATYEGLLAYQKVSDGNVYDGYLMHYTNPATGGHVMSTMGASMQLLPAGFKGKAHRHTGSFLYQVAKGSGYSIVNGKRLNWEKNDVFCVPSWAWHEHVNGSASEDACLFCFNDLPAIEAMGFYREEALADNNGHQPV